MATFHQQHQTVQYQVNGETVHVNEGSRHLVEKIDELIAQVGRAENADELVPVVDCLEQARAASAGGDQGRAVTMLRRAAEVAAPVAAVMTSITAVVQGFQ
ncbi:hypothetical protein [Micromonospora sagamiensis]|uniref:Uncharacterized protein n=1 Tax=Micromonospora sagamiensis TaxID=47875 RepID=A0A562WCT8_9ACTN|nr:hypothetical protein [Micromonospora sagamiensis]TWJ28099.1 hypothetical protein JD81_01602 [Micromonospora sagamiensis]BCL13012.1 hypothetical protein GCM10017556_07510 [Micromonospora sagamiensis]